MVEPILNILSPLNDGEAFDPEWMPGFLLILYIAVYGNEQCRIPGWSGKLN